MAAFLELNKCPVCGKEFVPAPQHQYKMERGKKLVCSYSCETISIREWNEKKKKSKERQKNERESN